MRSRVNWTTWKRSGAIDEAVDLMRSNTIHFVAAIVFMFLSLLGFSRQTPDQKGWQMFAILCLAASLLALLLGRWPRPAVRQDDEDRCATQPGTEFPEGQARLIDSGHLPNRYHPHLTMHEFETCHFFAPARRLLFKSPPDETASGWHRFLLRCSGGRYYFIRQPGELLMPAQLDKDVPGELVITSQRIIFLSDEDAFEVPLQRLALLDCSARLVDFEVRSRRYTLYCDAACYAEKVLLLLQQGNP